MRPLASGSVVQSSVPAGRASTNTKSKNVSVSRSIQNDRPAPSGGTSMVRLSRLNAESPLWEYAYRSPVLGVAAGSKSVGSMASQNLMPLSRYARTSNSPTAIIAR